MNQQLSQAITLLQYNSLELKHLIQQYIDQNPMIEYESIDIIEENNSDDNDCTAQNLSASQEDIINLQLYSADINRSHKYAGDESLLENVSLPTTLRQHLIEQLPLCKFDTIEQTIAEAIIDSINEDGRLTSTEDEIIHTLKIPQTKSELFHKVLQRIHQFDPPGIAAYTLQECLIIQLKYSQVKTNDTKNAEIIINDYFELLAKNKFVTIQNKMKINRSELNDALAIIKSLDPKPGNKFLHTPGHLIEPELIVKKIRGKWTVFLNESILSKIKINKEYQNIIKNNKNHHSYESLNKDLQEAKWLIKGLQRRNETLLNTATQIVKHQISFLEHGKTHMKPLIIADIASELGLHESTISRVTTGKYISTPFGVFELKYFFPSYVLTNTGHTCSEVAVKEQIKEIIINETPGHIHSDSDIAKILEKRGIKIARRTIAKYREALKILPSYQRASKCYSEEI